MNTILRTRTFTCDSTRAAYACRTGRTSKKNKRLLAIVAIYLLAGAAAFVALSASRRAEAGPNVSAR